MSWRALLAGGLLAGLLGACAVVDPVDSRYDTVTRSLAKARNESIFLNLVRASHDYPLSFATIANVTPTMTNTSSFALPSFSFGPPNCLPTALPALTRSCSFPTGIPGASVGINNSTASNQTAVSTNFSISTQENGAFYNGFLKPVDLQTVGYFIRQGYPRELLFWLFADSVEIDVPGKPAIGTHYDPPSDYGCPKLDPRRRCFAEFVLMAIGAGLTVEEKTIQKPASGKGGGGSESGGGKPQTTIFSRFCFDPVLAQEAQNQMGGKWREIASRYLDLPTSKFSPQCGGNWDPEAEASKPQPDYSRFQVGPILFKIRGRSAYGIFEFLGNLIRMERDHLEPIPGVYIPPGRLEAETVLPQLYTDARDPSIITVTLNDRGECFAHTWFNDGD
ncbi:MAG TPA: hypothetical protein VMU69_15390, partial [Bradyrhizobium sp.]|nr:hypothetical protein [Bradyrhizobium sp.]